MNNTTGSASLLFSPTCFLTQLLYDTLESSPPKFSVVRWVFAKILDSGTFAGSITAAERQNAVAAATYFTLAQFPLWKTIPNCIFPRQCLSTSMMIFQDRYNVAEGKTLGA